MLTDVNSIIEVIRTMSISEMVCRVKNKIHDVFVYCNLWKIDSCLVISWTQLSINKDCLLKLFGVTLLPF